MCTEVKPRLTGKGGTIVLERIIVWHIKGAENCNRRFVIMNKEVMLNLIVKFYFAHYEVMWKAKHKENDDLKKKIL